MNAPRKPTRVAIYARTSTSDKGQDIGLQTDELTALAAQRNWRVVEVYKDEGLSGSKTQRPGLDAMLADAQAGRFDVVVVFKLDRLGRSTSHLLHVLDLLKGWGVGFASARDPGIDTTTPQGRLLLHLLASFAEFERELARERIIAGVRRAQAKGTHCGRPKVEFDLRPALAMLKEGHGLTTTAKALGVARSTLRRRLMEAGEWTPGPPLVAA